METRYVKGSWNVLCQYCGHKFKSDQLRKEWTGLMACCGAGTNNCWSPRHPQDHVTGRVDKQAPPWTSPEPVDVFRTVEVTADDL